MMKRALFVLSIASVSYGVIQLTHIQATLVALTQGSRTAAIDQSSGDLRVMLVGTGVGPRVDLQQFGPSTLIEAGNERLLFDCGRGATLRLTQMGVPIGSIRRLFLTHLHSDHVIQIPDLLLTGWVGGGRMVPLEVWGPEGTRGKIAIEIEYAEIWFRRIEVKAL
jgi:ribonuclease Z